MTTAEKNHYGLIIDGLNCAKLSREQIERTRAGKVAAMNFTIIRPWADFETAMADLGQTLNFIDEMSDIVMIAMTTADIQKAQAGRHKQ